MESTKQILLPKNFNVLENWYLHFKEETSFISIKPNKRIRREDVEFCYTTLQKFFSHDYFILENLPYTKPRDQKFSLKSNYIIQSLTNFSENGFWSVFNFASIIDFSNRFFHKSYILKLQSLINNSEKFRDLIFEAFVFRLFFKTNANPEIGKFFENQALDLEISIHSRKFIVECKRISLGASKTYKLLQGVKNFWWKKWAETQPEVFLFIRTFQDTQFLEQDYIQLIGKFINLFILKGKDALPFSGIKTLHNRKYELVQLESFNHSLFENLKLLEQLPHYFFGTYFPPIINPSGFNKMQFNFGFKLELSIDEMEHKLVTVLDKIKKQHGPSMEKPIIAFIDNETTCFGEVSGLILDKMNLKIVNDYINKYPGFCAIVLIDKDYRPGNSSLIRKIVITRDDEQELRNFLELSSI